MKEKQSLLIKLFYLFKPLIPRGLQLFLRSKLIKIKIKKYINVWPILKGSEKKPDGWEGWPENRKFAFILTHDVEHQRGYEKVIKLMKVEKEAGFVSSFNFIPERDYNVENSLLRKLAEGGFEVGVHGLNHDGKLFLSEEIFLSRAKKIKNYLKQWDAVGFRAPAMHHNLDWIGELNLDYDLSTFDVDPFEPQNDGVKTIFPFWVKNSRHINGGYVEVPYTLVQDFTLLVLMKEKSPAIWIKKLNWIAENGGMALLNVHPDYIQFEDESAEVETFPIEVYKDFLLYVKENYSSQFWNPLPKELAAFWRKKYHTQ